ncbi:MAG: isoamylase early set domain-containing protein [Gemmatimonadetes bacterium]|nr:isoamylase early set domain-containing protein [Gemmatimonadota bacterium]
MPEYEDELVTRVVAELKGPVALDPALDQRIMVHVRAHPRRRRAWLFRSRTFSVTPLGLLARAAVLAAIVAGATLAVSRSRPAPEVVGATNAVPFVLYAPGAQSVALVGDFNGWDKAATPLRATGSGGAWVVTVPLPPGRYRYAFLIDGTRWLADPGAPRAADDDFGTPNSVLTVGT